jgi:DNA-binding response OmpR family regulator
MPSSQADMKYLAWEVLSKTHLGFIPLSRSTTMSEKENLPRRVLLIEDDREVANPLLTLLLVAGYDVEMALDGPTAVETAESFRPDVCLVDVNVPRLNVYELARCFRESLENLPLLANITPFAERDDWDADAEFDLEFTAPSDPLAVVDQLSDFLRNDPTKTRSKVPSDTAQLKLRMPERRRNTLPHTAGSWLRK